MSKCIVTYLTAVGKEGWLESQDTTLSESALRKKLILEEHKYIHDELGKIKKAIGQGSSKYVSPKEPDDRWENDDANQPTPKAEVGKEVEVTPQEGIKEVAKKLREKADKIDSEKPAHLKNVKKQGLGTSDLLRIFADALDATGDFIEAAKAAYKKLEEYFNTTELSDSEKEKLRNDLGDVIVDFEYSEKPTKEEAKEPAIKNEQETKPTESPKKKLRGVIDTWVNRSDLDEDAKQELLNNENSYYNVLSREHADSLAQAIIDEMGVEEAVSEAMKDNSQIPISLQSLVMGKGLLYGKEQMKKAKNQEEKDKWADYQNEIQDKMSSRATAFGQYVAFLSDVYESGYAIVRRYKKQIEAINKVYGKNVKKGVDEIQQIFDDPQHEQDALEQVFDNAEKETTVQLQKEIDALKKQLEGLKKEGKKGVSAKKRIISKDKYNEYKKRLLELSANPMFDPRKWEAVAGIALYHIEDGYVKFEEFYKKMKKDLKGLYEEMYADAFREARDKAKESSKETFETDEEIQDVFERIQNEGEEIKRQMAEKEIQKLVIQYGKLLSEGLPNDSQKKKSKEQALNELSSKLDEHYGGTEFRENTDDYFGIEQEEKDAKDKQRKIADFGKMLSEKLPDGKEKVLKEKRLRDLAKSLDEKLGGTSFTDAVDSYFGIKNQEKTDAKTKSEIIELSKQMSERLPDGKPKLDREKSMREKAKSLDEKLGGTSFTDAVDSYFGIKNQEAKAKKTAREAKIKAQKNANEIAAKERALQKKMSEAIPSQNVKDYRNRAQKMIDEARELDNILGGNTYERQVNAYLANGNNVNNIIKEALIEAGFVKEVNGKKQVDWKKVTTQGKGTSEIVEIVKAHIESKYPNSKYAGLVPIVMRRVDELVKEKKAKAIEAKAKQITRHGINKISAAVTRRNRIKSLIEVWKQGGLSNEVIKDKMAKDFGITTITPQQDAEIEAMLETIDNAQQGFEQEREEEKLQAYLEYHGHPNFLAKSFLERMKTRLLAGPITAVKNTLGTFEAMVMVSYKAAINQVSKKGIGDKEVFKVIAKAHRQMFANFAEILINGGVDTGLAQSEQTGNKEGSPRVRFLENPRSDFRKQNNTWQKFVRTVNKLDRIPQRFLSAVDAMNHTMLQQVEAYNLLKDGIKNQYPNMSNAQASKLAYERLYSVSIEQARAQALQEYSDRGIVPTKQRLNRRIYEINQQAIDNEVNKKALYFANRYTYKAADIGIASGAAHQVSNFRTAISNSFEKLKKLTNDPLAHNAIDLAKFMFDFSFDLVMPFIKTVGNILEKGMELNPMYGAWKAAGYTIVGLYNKANGNKGIYDLERAGEYYWRTATGLIGLALLYTMADDDEEDKMKAIYGEGAKEWKEKVNRGKQRPVNTVRIAGHNIPFDMFGPFATSFRMEAAKQDALRYKDGARSVVSNLINDLYFEQGTRIIQDLRSDDRFKWQNTLKRIGTEAATRSMIPITGFFRQTGQMVKPKAQQPATMPEYLLKYSGLIGGWALNRPAFDYRGKSYDSGNVYTSSADGAIKMFSKFEKIDEVDKMVLEFAPTMMQKSQSDDALVIWSDNEFRPLTNEEFYEVKKKSAENLNLLLEGYLKENGYPNPSNVEIEKDLLSDLTALQLESATKEAMKYFAENSIVSNDEQMDEKVLEIALTKKRLDKIKENLLELNRTSIKAAMEEFYLKRGLRVPYDVVGFSDISLQN